MAKKKGSRKTASRGARKKTAVRRTARKAAKRPRAARAATIIGLEHPDKVDLKPLKEAISAHIDRLKLGPFSDDVAEALRALEVARESIRQGCARTSMVIDF